MTLHVSLRGLGIVYKVKLLSPKEQTLGKDQFLTDTAKKGFGVFVAQ